MPRPPRATLLLGLILLTLAGPVSARGIVVLVHGYLGDAASWERAQIAPALIEAGWRPAGTWQSTPDGVRLVEAQGADARAARLLYRVSLPSTAPLGIQASYLAGMLQGIARRQPSTGITLIGHSAGGVVARLALV